MEYSQLFIKIGFSINDAYEFLTVHGFIKPWCIYEETGLSVVNDYALEHIVVV